MRPERPDAGLGEEALPFLLRMPGSALQRGAFAAPHPPALLPSPAMTSPLSQRKPFKPWVLAMMIAGATCAFAAAWFSFEQNTVWATRFGIAALVFYVISMVVRRSGR